ncbi:MAG TPA: hypothetical protein VGG44_12015 [Tepidisphaeraceae bacterium]|jgi:hypothetical protein
MSDKAEGFRGLSIEQVQMGWFLRKLPARKGRYCYPSSGLNAEPGTVVLFQYRARIIASAVFLHDEKFERPIDGCAGELYFDAGSFRTFDPQDVQAMRKVWPRFRGFGHAKQFLNPELYPMFKRRLKRVASPRR